MKINPIARKAIAEKLSSALKREGLTHKEAAVLFNIKSDRVSKFLNDKHRDLITDDYVEPFKEWSNTGEALRAWAKKNNHGVITAAPKDAVVRDKIEPEKATPLEELADNLRIEAAINEIREVAKKCNVSDEELEALFRPFDYPSMDGIQKLLDEKLAKQPDILLATTEETHTIDRLDIVLGVISEIKEMGFDVDIHISPKEN